MDQYEEQTLSNHNRQQSKDIKPQPRSGLHAAKRMPTPILSGMNRTSELLVSPALASLAPRILTVSHLFCLAVVDI